MKIVYIHQFFMTNRGASGTRSYDVAKYMVKAGHQVHMITGIYDISGIEPLPWYRLFRSELIDGIEVTVCNVLCSNKFGMFRRLRAFLWFAFLATIAVLRVKKPDLVFATSTPLTVGIPGYLGALFKKAAFVFEVRDIMPQAYVESGALKPGLIFWLGECLEKFIYAKSLKVLLVSYGFEKKLCKRGFPPEKLKTILLGADGNLFMNVKPDYSFLEKYELKDKTIAVYTGAHGRANGLYYIIEAAGHTRDRTDIVYVLIGAGSKKEELMAMAKARSLDNIIFADAVSKIELVGILAVCHIGLMILRHLKAGRPVMPNKIFDYMFTGIPSIVNFEGPTVDMVKADGCGVYADGTDPADLAEKVKMLADDPQLCKQMGENAKKAAWEKYDRKIIAEQLLEIFEEVLSSFKKGTEK